MRWVVWTVADLRVIEDDGAKGVRELNGAGEHGGGGVSDGFTPDRSRNRRKREVRDRSLRAGKDGSRSEAERLRLENETFYPKDVAKPLTRGECSLVTRPCPFVSCRFHLAIDVNENTGTIKLNFPDLEIWELSETCALDVAERGGLKLEAVGEVMNITRERVRQIEAKAKSEVEPYLARLLDVLQCDEVGSSIRVDGDDETFVDDFTERAFMLDAGGEP